MGESGSLDGSRQLIFDVLTGAATAENCPGLLEDDLLFFAVNRVEQGDPTWLREILGREPWPRDRIDCILASLSPPGRRALREFFDPRSLAARGTTPAPGTLRLADADRRWSFDLPAGPGMSAVIGRQPPADIVIPDARVSRRHARLFFARGGWFVEDAGSTSGTRLDGLVLRDAAPLRDGARLQIGGVGLDVTIVDG